MKKKTMYYVEKFLPTECPKCKKKFQGDQDFIRYLGDVIDGEKRIYPSVGYIVVICRDCDNYTALYPLESYQFSKKEDAEAKLKEGFVNLKEVVAVGSHTEDHHAVYSQMPGVNIEALDCTK